MVYKFFNKNSAGGGIVKENGNDKSNNDNDNDNNDIKQNDIKQNNITQTIIRKFKKRKVYSGFRDNIWGVDLADMQLISKFNKGFRFLCVIDIFCKYAWVVPIKD